jgi:prepilin-type processing-associated H-X9-DG protein
MRTNHIKRDILTPRVCHDKTAPSVLAGFGRLDLFAVLASVAILASVTVSGSSTAKSASQAVQCLENGDQLMRAWSQYADCNGGWLAPNSDDGAYGNWLGGELGGGNYGDATNYGEMNNTFVIPGAKKVSSALGHYIVNYRICRCPADTSTAALSGIGGTAGKLPRVRSYSMSGGVGTKDTVKQPVDGTWLAGSPGYNNAFTGPFHTFGMLSSFVQPGPSSTFVIVDEDPYSINDAALGTSMGPDEWVDVPAAYHNGGCMVTFADGHCIIKRWIDPRTLVRDPGPLYGSQPSNPDIEWLRSVTTTRVDGKPITITNPSP